MQLTQTVTVLRLSEEVLTADSLQTVERSLEEEDVPVIHLDLGDVRLPTAEGLGALVVLNKDLRARGGALSLINVPTAVYEVIRLANLVGILAVCGVPQGQPPLLETSFNSRVEEPSL
jgi:anti-anti-sigma regulatory factor